MTSKDTIISSGSIFCWHVKTENDLELWVCCSFTLPLGFDIFQCILIFRRVAFLCMIQLVALGFHPCGTQVGHRILVVVFLLVQV